MTPLFQAALGPAWNDLPEPVRALHGGHGVARFAGEADITRGHSWIARVAARIAGFPRAGQGVAVELTITPVSGGEVWVRRFGDRPLRSFCFPSPVPGHSRERMGPFTFELALPVRDGVLSLEVRRGWCLGVPLPRRLLPESAAREYAEAGRFRFDIAATAPLGGGLIVRYRGWLVPVADG